MAHLSYLKVKLTYHSLYVSVHQPNPMDVYTWIMMIKLYILCILYYIYNLSYEQYSLNKIKMYTINNKLLKKIQAFN